VDQLNQRPDSCPFRAHPAAAPDDLLRTAAGFTPPELWSRELRGFRPSTSPADGSVHFQTVASVQLTAGGETHPQRHMSRLVQGGFGLGERVFKWFPERHMTNQLIATPHELNRTPVYIEPCDSVVRPQKVRDL
jgi:hypothetical protein